MAPASLSQLKTIVLRSADLPSSWKAAAHTPDPSESANNAAMVACVGTRNTESDQVATANSDDFANQSASISSSATSYKSQSDLDSNTAMLRSSKLGPCFEQMMNKQLKASLQAGSSIESTSIKITPGSAGGPSNVIATGTGTIKIKVSGQAVPVYLTVAFIKGPLIVAEVDGENIGSPVPASVVNSAVNSVATRAAQG